MENLKTLNRVCWVLAMVTGVVMVVIALICVWAENAEALFEHLWRIFLTALILFLAAAVTIALNNTIIGFAIRSQEKGKASAAPQPPDSSA